MIGLFINAVPMLVDLPGEQPMGAWLRELQRLANDLRQHEHTPLSDIQRWAGLAGDALFDTLLVFENFPVDLQARSVDVGLRIERSERADRTHYPLTLTVEAAVNIELEWEWDGARVDGARVEWLSKHYVEVLEQFTARSAERLAAIELTTTSPWSKATTYPYRSILQQIEAQSATRGAERALTCEGESLSYTQLEHWSGGLAADLRAAGVITERLVGLCMSRSVALVASVLAVWKAGGVLVPLDPTYPKERLKQMLSGVPVVLADAAAAALLRQIAPKLRVLEVQPQSEYQDVQRVARGGAWRAEQLAYVIYTSGSTGEPKGVAVSHGALSSHIDDFVARYGIDERDCQLFSSTINFDVWLHELLPALTQGGRVVMRGERAWNCPL